ncbi:MAG: hypothetical protein SCH98_04555 [Deferrisomatales bacterium]|nr:hypothetical protein [Deferrisomatales bacterium]
MKTKPQSSWRGLFLLAFAVLTLMTWSPLGYGSYGPPQRVFGVPDWVVIALAAGVVLFVLQWIYLFHSGLALGDEDMERILSRLKEDQARERAAALQVVEREAVNS